jgi:predicted dehydrogenase
VAVADKVDATLEWFRRSAPELALTTADYREILARKDVDAVYCAVPHFLHREIYTDILKAGKHLLGEKPFGMNQADNAAIVAEAARHPHLVARSGSQFGYFPGAWRIIRAISDKRFGRIVEVEAEYLHSSDLNPTKPINWKRQAKFCGEYGCMGDLGMHALSIPLRAGWVPDRIFAVLNKIFDKRPDAAGNLVPCDTWDNATLLCEVPAPEGRFPMTLRLHRVAPGEVNSWNLSIRGTRFSARFSLKFPRTLETLSYEPGGPQVWAREDLTYDPVYKTIAGGIFEFGYADAYQQMLASYCDQIAKGPAGKVPFGCVTPEETRVQHAIFTAALESDKRKTAAEVRV